MSGKGGARIGAGRKPLHDDIRARDLCLAAIEANFGSLLEGLQALLQSGEPTLIKFVYEHALGKPKERIESDINSVVEQIQIIQLPDNNRGDIDIRDNFPSAN
jgi:hypothetical protein